jgi:hypothetical protein
VAFNAVMWEQFGATDDDVVVQAAALHSMWVALTVGAGAPVPATTTPARVGSRAGREPNVDSDVNAGVARFQRDYFIDTAAARSTRRRDPCSLCVRELSSRLGTSRGSQRRARASSPPARLLVPA